MRRHGLEWIGSFEKALRAEEELQLSTWGWADEADGLARVPIERAMEMLVEQRGAMAEEDDS